VHYFDFGFSIRELLVKKGRGGRLKYKTIVVAELINPPDMAKAMAELNELQEKSQSK